MELIVGGDVVRSAPALNVSDEEIATGLDRFAIACKCIHIMRIIRHVEHVDIAVLMQIAGKTGSGLILAGGR